MRGTGNFARREDDHRMAFHEAVVNLLHRLFGVAVVYTDASQALEHGTQVPLFEMILVARDAQRARAGHLHHGPVDEAVVVTDQEHRSVVRDIAHIEHADLVTAKDKAQERADEGLRKVRNGPVENAHRYDGQPDEIVLRLYVRVTHHSRIHEQEHHKY